MDGREKNKKLGSAHIFYNLLVTMEVSMSRKVDWLI